jgi:hypothetical protein
MQVLPEKVCLIGEMKYVTCISEVGITAYSAWSFRGFLTYSLGPAYLYTISHNLLISLDTVQVWNWETAVKYAETRSAIAVLLAL